MNTLFCTCDYYVLYYHIHMLLTTLGLLQTQKEKHYTIITAMYVSNDIASYCC